MEENFSRKCTHCGANFIATTSQIRYRKYICRECTADANRKYEEGRKTQEQAAREAARAQRVAASPGRRRCCYADKREFVTQLHRYLALGDKRAAELWIRGAVQREVVDEEMRPALLAIVAEL